MPNRQRLIVLDTETTGVDPKKGDRIVEIGCVELINRQFTGRTYHAYINPQREMDQEVIDVHGLTNEFLADKPLFANIAQEFIEFIKGSTLVIHNAKFDVGFMDNEFNLMRQGLPQTADFCGVIDTLKISKDEFGSPKTLDYLARYFKVDQLVDRTYHGALIDAQLLAFVYIEMTRKQQALNLSADSGDDSQQQAGQIQRISADRAPLAIIQATEQELQAHQERLALIQEKGGNVLWQ